MGIQNFEKMQTIAGMPKIHFTLEQLAAKTCK
jgi:hypothetical protein